MLYHVSIEADDPRRVARFLALVVGGIAVPFPSEAHGSWVALAADAHKSMIEIYPRGTELHEAEGNGDAAACRGQRRRHNAAHVSIGTDLPVETLYVMADREGWPVRYCRRAGLFGVVEIWVEGCQLVEVMTAEMQREYLASVDAERWQSMALAPGRFTAAAA